MHGLMLITLMASMAGCAGRAGPIIANVTDDVVDFAKCDENGGALLPYVEGHLDEVGGSALAGPIMKDVVCALQAIERGVTSQPSYHPQTSGTTPIMLLTSDGMPFDKAKQVRRHRAREILDAYCTKHKCQGLRRECSTAADCDIGEDCNDGKCRKPKPST